MPQTKKTQPIIKIVKRHSCALVGAMVYLLTATIIVLLGPKTILIWVTRSSSNPIITFWSASIFLSGVVYVIGKLGGELKITISPFAVELNANRKAIACIFGMPYWATVVLLLAGLTGIILTRSLCQPPVVAVTATYEDEDKDVKSISPGRTLNTALNSSAVFNADTLNSTAIACEWDYAGNAILSLEPQNGCIVRMTFSQEQGEVGVVTLSAMDSQCSQRNVFSFNVEIK